jgi:amino acid adenylation domain-containing protein
MSRQSKPPAASRPDAPVRDAPSHRLTDDELNTIIHAWNDNEAPWPRDRCIHELFEAQAAATPSHIAVIDGDCRVTYRELFNQTTLLAGRLIALGVGTDVPVCLLADRGADTIAAIYGILRAGGFYVPLDAGWPVGRIARVLADVAPPVLVTVAANADQVPDDYGGAVLLVDALTVDTGAAPPTGRRATPASAVYCLYTSGSAGDPKGVVVEHRGLVKRIQWLQDQYPLAANDRVLHRTPCGFGISEWELFWALPHGASIVVAAPAGHRDAVYLHRLMLEHRVSIGFFVPSMLALLLEHLEAEGVNRSLPLRLMFTCGEALTAETCSAFFRGFDARLVNLYGPTEADMTFWECPRLGPGDTVETVPIGRPISNATAYVLDDNLRPLAIGATGQLYLGGATSARGYLNRPDLTATAFLPNPFGAGRIYKTGDLARWRADGNLEFLGRADRQLKLRGYRIEPGDIESVLLRHPDVAQALVLLRGDDPATHQLVGYVTPDNVDVERLLVICRAQLPPHMVPSGIVPMTRFPLTDRQKVDRAALRRISPRRRRSDDTPFVPPRTDMERTIEQVWRGVLDIETPIDVEADFVTLGGTSLLAGRATTLLRHATSVNLPGTAMYTHPTIARLASLISQLEREGDDGTPVAPATPAARSRWRGDIPTSPTALLWQLAGIMLTPFTGDVAYVAVAYLLAYGVSRQYGSWVMAPAVVLAIVLETVVLALLALALKWLVLGRVRPGRHPVYGAYYLRWWLVTGVVNGVTTLLANQLSGTVLFNVWYRLLGARVGRRVLLDTEIETPDLVSLGDDVTIERETTINPATVQQGELILTPIAIGNGCRVAPRAHVTPGTSVPDWTSVGPLSTTTPGNATDMRPTGARRPVRPQTALHLFVGAPLLLILFALPAIPEAYLLESIHDGLVTRLGPDGLLVFWAVMPWVYLFVLGECFFLEVVLMKRLVVGRFRPGPRSHTAWDCFRRWLIERLTHNDLFDGAMAPWVGTEILSIKYRMLGARIGRRVAIDYFGAIEHDMVTVGDNCMFGAGVTLVTSDDEETRPIMIERGANVLDTCCLMPGVTVMEGALCGSSTLGPKGHTFPAHSVSTGNRGGTPVLLRQRKDDIAADPSGIPSDEQTLIARARQRHASTRSWLGYNLWVVLSGAIWTPVENLMLLGLLLFWLRSGLETWALVLLTPPVYLGFNVLHALVVCAAKWLLTGRIRAGNYPFYGWFHFRWAMLIHVLNSASGFTDLLGGTVFAGLYNRMLGTRVGKNTCLMATAFRTREPDLVEVGDETSVNDDALLSCHTVENMVLKLAPARTGRGCTLRGGAVLMPGAAMEEGAVLLEQSQVLKGETVPAGTVWAGLPATQVGVVAPEARPPGFQVSRAASPAPQDAGATEAPRHS